MKLDRNGVLTVPYMFLLFFDHIHPMMDPGQAKTDNGGPLLLQSSSDKKASRTIGTQVHDIMRIWTSCFSIFTPCVALISHISMLNK